jgi:hypothetical protein
MEMNADESNAPDAVLASAIVRTRGSLWKLTRSEERLPRTYKEAH